MEEGLGVLNSTPAVAELNGINAEGGMDADAAARRVAEVTAEFDGAGDDVIADGSAEVGVDTWGMVWFNSIGSMQSSGAR
jgi:hypothetical protein